MTKHPFFHESSLYVNVSLAEVMHSAKNYLNYPIHMYQISILALNIASKTNNSMNVTSLIKKISYYTKENQNVHKNKTKTAGLDRLASEMLHLLLNTVSSVWN